MKENEERKNKDIQLKYGIHWFQMKHSTIKKSANASQNALGIQIVTSNEVMRYISGA